MNATQRVREATASYPRLEAPCPYFGTCGGCTLQELSPSDQLTLKRRWLHEALRILDPGLQVELVASEEPWRYRNKAELTFSEREGRLILGYHVAGSFSRIVDIEDCLLLPESMAQCLGEVRRLAQASRQPAYNPRTHQGFFRFLTIRRSHTTGTLLVCVTTTPGSREIMEDVADALMQRQSAVVSVYWGVRESVGDISAPEQLTLLRGVPSLDDQIGRFHLTVHPLSFLQPNLEQAQRIYAHLMSVVREVRAGSAWDLYCGMGLVAFFLAEKFRQVYGVDSSPFNLELAQRHAVRNGITNVTFHLGAVEDLLGDRRYWLGEAKPDVAVVDPPRAGLHPRVLSALLAARPQQILYLSCNVKTLVRDLQGLLAGYPRYRLDGCRGFDMFPQTSHVELLAVLERI